MVNYQKIAIGFLIIFTIIAIIAVLSYLLIKNNKEKYTLYTGKVNGKSKKVIMNNIAASQSSTDEVCQIIGTFCDLTGTLGQNLQQGFGMLCQKLNLMCWDCDSMQFPPNSSAFPKACIKGNICNMDNLCDYVGDMWYYLGELRNNISQTFAVYYDTKGAPYSDIPTVDVVLPDALKSGGSGCNSGNVLELTQQALNTLTAISDEVGKRFDDITYVSGCH